MTGLFIRFYVCVLVVLSLAWYIHGSVLQRRADADRARVVVAAHRGGALLLAGELDAVPPASRPEALNSLRQLFAYPVEILPVSELPASLQRQIAQGGDVVYASDDDQTAVCAALSTRAEVVRLGPFPSYRLREIEESLGGWMRLTAQTLESTPTVDRTAVLQRLAERFAFPLALLESTDELSAAPRQRILDGEDVVFFPDGNENWFAATPLRDSKQMLVFGPFPQFDQIEHKAATTTLALVLLPVALAIALLLRPVARQLLYVERATKAIAGGNLSARVDERRVHSARSLAQSFNQMAARTESLVRTQRELLQAVSHELRTPLSRMRFAIELIASATTDSERQPRLEALDAATEELDALVGELLNYVRAEATEPLCNREAIAVKAAIRQLIARFATLFPAIHFEVQEHQAPSEITVFADPGAFQRAIGNLLSNAGRFANSQVRLTVCSSNGVTTIDVDDDGKGIPAAERERVFEPFVRLEDRSKSNIHGVGLGLALVRRIVTQHGGTVEALSSPLGGCLIRTTWPHPPLRQADIAAT